MNKRWFALPCGLLTLALAAGAQEQVVICPRGNPDECYAPDDPRASAQSAPDATQSLGSGWPNPDPSSGLAAEGQALLEWQAGVREPDPLLRVPGMCARTAGRARDRFEQAMQANDLNALVATYQWRGKDETSAAPLIDRLSQLPLDGLWESSFVSGSVGEGDLAKVPTYWRWAGHGTSQAFAMRNVDGCWFVEFSGRAPDTVALPARTQLLEQLPQADAPSSALPDILTF